MATYKKRGYKPKKEKLETVDAEVEETFDESQSTVAETFNTLDETANKSEQWIEKNSKSLFYGLIGVAVLALAYLGYNNFVAQPNDQEASNELAHPRMHFNKAQNLSGKAADSLYRVALEGGVNGKFGFIDVAETYSGTKAGNIANYYAGISFLKLKNYEKAINYLSNFKSNDKVLGTLAIGAIGDAYADTDKLSEALSQYEKASNNEKNDFTTPLFLFKAGQTAMSLKEFSKAEKLFTTIKDSYSSSEQGKDIDKYINGAKYAQ